MALAATFTSAITLLSIWIYSLYSNHKLEENFVDKIGILEDFIKANGLGNIINEKTLSIWESTAQSVWVVSLDLVNDLGVCGESSMDCELVDVVRSNLKKGKHYTYFVPNTTIIHGAINQYKKIHFGEYVKGQVSFCIVPKNDFHFTNEIVLYDAEENSVTRAVQWFPNTALNYYLELDAKHQGHMIGILKYFRQKYGLIEIENI